MTEREKDVFALAKKSLGEKLSGMNHTRFRVR